MHIAIYGRQHGEFVVPYVEQVISELKQHNCSFTIYESFYNFLAQYSEAVRKCDIFTSTNDLRNNTDFLFCIGGDGSMLDTVTLVQDTGIPVMGINTGRLGFLSSVSKEDFSHALENLIIGNYSIDKRTLLRLESSQKLFGDVKYALNELTVIKKYSATMIKVHVYLNGEFLNSYWADGIIISTPTGSTGYSMSCGGPIIIPQSENFVITPIAPHNLNVRPVVVSDKNIISLEIEGRSGFYLASLDARSVTIDSSVQLAVRREDFSFNRIRFENDNFLNTIRTKLSWGLDTRN